MGLLQRVKHDLKAGLATLRLGTAQVANRALEETELLRIRLEIRKLDQQLGDLYRDVGERAVNLREGREPVERVLYDAEIGRLVTYDASRRRGYRHAHLPVADRRSAAWGAAERSAI